MSRRVDPADEFWAREVGALTLLSKPIANRRLVEEVATILAARNAGR
jgi:hypothetical protein